MLAKLHLLLASWDAINSFLMVQVRRCSKRLRLLLNGRFMAGRVQVVELNKGGCKHREISAEEQQPGESGLCFPHHVNFEEQLMEM